MLSQDRQKLDSLIAKVGVKEAYAICFEMFMKIKNEPIREKKYLAAMKYCQDMMSPTDRLLIQNKII